MDTGTDRLIAEKKNGVGRITFNSPAKRNAMNYDMWVGMGRALKAWRDDPDVRLVILSGAGDKAFVSGADISEFEEKRSTADSVAVYNAATDEATRALVTFPKPTIARIRGFCVGGGMGIAISCDLRVASDDSRFAVPAAKLGLGYAYPGIARLASVVGPSFTQEIFFTGRLFDAKEAETMGLINRLVPVDKLDATVDELAGRIAENAPMTIAAVKMAVSAYLQDPAKRDLAAVQAAVDGCFASADYKEGRTAFMEKRKPQFRGR